MAKLKNTVVPLLVSAVISIGFVAFAGKAVLWTRFSALKVPPDQVVKAVPQSEAVAVGASILLIFGFFGAIATLMTYLVDRGGRATPGMSRAVLALVTLEGVAMVVVASGLSSLDKVVLAVLVLAPILLALGATFVGRLVELRDTHLPRPAETLEAESGANFLIDDTGKLRASVPQLLAVAGPVAVALGLFVVLAVVDLSVFLKIVVIWGIVASLAVAVIMRGGPAEEIASSLELEHAHEAALRDNEGAVPADEEERRRTGKHRPFHFVLKPGGAFLIVVLAAFSVVVPALVLGEWWFAVSMGSAIVLGFGLWRIANLRKENFVWFGFAVFLSVPLFGTLTLMARNLGDPQAQPVALIRTTDGPDESIQGLYVTETDERVYFATVATEGCSDDLTPGSGRLEWVPKAEVVAMSIGPLQSVGNAGRRALEMAYALTPAVETGSDAVTVLNTSGKKAAKEEPKAPESPSPGNRLEHTGPAVRPNFGNGLSLSTEDASPGEEVILRMSAPNKNVEGFGPTRGGRALRVGGVRAEIVKEPARSVENAEYLKTRAGSVLTLAKGEPYARQADGKYVSAAGGDAGLGSRRFLKLTDSRILEAGGQLMTRAGIYLELEGPESPQEPPRLAPGYRTAALKVAGQAGARGLFRRVQLVPQPLGQAWHEREIKFEVPERAVTGAVTVECSQLAGQPLLEVAHAPEARISVRMARGSNRVIFDSGRSTDADNEELSRRWSIAGLRRGNLSRTSIDLPPRFGAYAVRLTVTDESSRSGEVAVHLLRMPAPLFPFNESELEGRHPLKPARRALRRLVAKELPAAIEIDGYADDPGTPRYNARLSLQRAEYVRNELLRPRRPTAGAVANATIPVRILGYGEGCPVDARPGRRPRNRRVDVFVLDKGVSMVPLRDCHPRAFKGSKWRLNAAACAGGRPRTPVRKSLWKWLIRKLTLDGFGEATGADGSSAAKQSCNT